MGLTQFGNLIWAGKWRVLLCALACLLAAVVVSERQPKSYEAKARVLLEVARPDPVTGISVGNKQIESYIQTQQLLAMSTRVGERVIEKLGWTDNPQVIDAWRQQTNGDGEFRTWAAERVMGAAAAYPFEGGGTLEIAYRAPDPSTAEVIVRAIRESYIETTLALQTEAGARRAERFEALLKPARAALALAQQRLLTAQRETGTVLSSLGVDIEANQLQSLDTVAQRTEVLAQQDAINVSARASSNHATALRRSLAEVETQIAMAERVAGTENPGYQGLLTRRSELVRQLARELAAMRTAAAQTVGAARALAAAPQQAYLKERERVLGRASENLRINQAVRMVALRQNEVTRLANNLAAARLASERTESGLVVMGDVITNTRPVSPNIPLNAAIAAVFGIGLGLASVLIDGLARREVLGSQDLAGASGVPVLAVVPGSTQPAWWRRLLPRRRRGPVAA